MNIHQREWKKHTNRSLLYITIEINLVDELSVRIIRKATMIRFSGFYVSWIENIKIFKYIGTLRKCIIIFNLQ